MFRVSANGASECSGVGAVTRPAYDLVLGFLDHRFREQFPKCGRVGARCNIRLNMVGNNASVAKVCQASHSTMLFKWIGDRQRFDTGL